MWEARGGPEPRVNGRRNPLRNRQADKRTDDNLVFPHTKKRPDSPQPRWCITLNWGKVCRANCIFHFLYLHVFLDELKKKRFYTYETTCMKKICRNVWPKYTGTRYREKSLDSFSRWPFMVKRRRYDPKENRRKKIPEFPIKSLLFL